jgi:hypothetical protein
MYTPCYQNMRQSVLYFCGVIIEVLIKENPQLRFFGVTKLAIATLRRDGVGLEHSDPRVSIIIAVQPLALKRDA